MLILEKGAYLGKVLDLSEADGILAGATSYYPGDGTGVMHYHENSHLSFVLRGGGIEKRKSSECERAAGEIMFFRAGEPHQSINKLFPAPAELEKFVGTYELNGNFTFAVEVRDGKLYRVTKSGDPKELKAESKTKLFYADGTDRQIELVYEKQAVKQVFFIADGINLELKKAK